MADAHIPVTGGAGYNIDTRTEATNGHARQVIVLGDPSVNDNVVNAVTADPGASSTTPGIVFRLAGSATVQAINTTVGVYFDRGEPAVRTYGLDGATSRALRMNSDGAIKVYDLAAGTVSISSMPTTSGVYLAGTAGTLGVRVGQVDGTVAVYFSPATPAVSIAGTIATYFDESNPAVTAYTLDGTTKRALRGNSDGAIKVYDLAAGTVSISSMPTTSGVYIASTAGTIVVKLDPASAGLATDDAAFNIASGTGSPMMALLDDTATDTVNEGDAGIVRMTSNRILMMHDDSTASIFTASGSASGVSASGNTIISPSANASYKIFAFSIQTTGLVSLATKFTNGAGTGPTEFFRPLVTPASTTSDTRGANLSVRPPGHFFATGTNTTLALVLDSATLVHYSVSYIKESA